MRRYLVLFSCLVFCLSLFCIPAFASELQTYEAIIADGVGDFNSRILPGTYVVTLSIDSYDIALENDILVVTGEEGDYYDFWFDVEGRKYYLRIALYESSAYCEFLDSDEIQVQGSVGLCRVAPPGIPEPPVPSGNFLEDVGNFFSFAITSLAGVFGVIFNSPPLIILCIAFPVIGFSVALLKRTFVLG